MLSMFSSFLFFLVFFGLNRDIPTLWFSSIQHAAHWLPTYKIDLVFFFFFFFLCLLMIHVLPEQAWVGFLRFIDSVYSRDM